jgi:large repetitive protein
VVTSIAGSHTLSATYSGDANYAAAGPITRTYTVTSAAVAKITLSSTANPAQRCAPVTFSVAVAGGAGDSMPTGRVELKNGSTVLAAAYLLDGRAAFTTSALTLGENLLTASYAGDAHNSAGTSAVLKEMVVSGGSCSVIQPLRMPGERSHQPY